MKQQTSTPYRIPGLRFAPDNHQIPILRWRQYHKMAGPGYFLINPLVEETLPPVNIGLQVGNFTFENVLSRDNIPFTFNLTVLYRFELELAVRDVVAQLVRLTAKERTNIVKDYVSRGLHRLTSLHDALMLSGAETISSIEHELGRTLRATLKPLGLMPLSNGGILIKETIPPADFEQTMLDARKQEALLKTLQAFPSESLAELALKAQLYANMRDGQGNLTVLSSDGGTGQPPVTLAVPQPQGDAPARGHTRPLNPKIGRFPQPPAQS